MMLLSSVSLFLSNPNHLQTLDLIVHYKPRGTVTMVAVCATWSEWSVHHVGCCSSHVQTPPTQLPPIFVTVITVLLSGWLNLDLWKPMEPIYWRNYFFNIKIRLRFVSVDPPTCWKAQIISTGLCPGTKCDRFIWCWRRPKQRLKECE